MKYKKKNLISILITNYNKEKFLNKSLQSCLKQNFRDKEIILFDDCSNDKSLEIFKKYPSIKLIKNKKKKYLSGPQNQIYGMSKILQKSKGEIIFLLDSDDEFKLNKLATIFQKFKNDQNLKFIQDTPILTSSKKKMRLKNKKSFFTIWPSFFPTSCIAIRRNFLIKFFKLVKNNEFPNLEIDARLCIFASLKKEFNITKKSLTFYNYDPFGITSKYKKFSLSWWQKRNEAFEYSKFLTKKLEINFYKGPDYYITKFINLFIGLFYKSYH